MRTVPIAWHHIWQAPQTVPTLVYDFWVTVLDLTHNWSYTMHAQSFCKHSSPMLSISGIEPGA